MVTSPFAVAAGAPGHEFSLRFVRVEGLEGRTLLSVSVTEFPVPYPVLNRPGAITAGADLVCARRFSAREFWPTVLRERVTAVLQLEVQALFLLGDLRQQFVLGYQDERVLLLAGAGMRPRLDVVIGGHHPQLHLVTRLYFLDVIDAQAAWLQIEGGKDVALSLEELALLKKLIGKGYAPLIVG